MEPAQTHLSLSVDQQRQPVGPTANPSPLSGELDEIIEYMRFIGARRTQGRA